MISNAGGLISLYSGFMFIGIETEILAIAILITLVAGVVKGAVGFALPMIMISGIGSILPIETALAMLILPTVLTNATQALRQGWVEAWQSIRKFRVFLIVGGVFLVFGAQLVPRLSADIMFLLIGIPVTGFATLQLIGFRFTIPEGAKLRAEIAVAAVAGFIGGMSGVWGPPTVAYLTATDTQKHEHVRVQGVIYALGAMLLMVTHLQTGVLSVERAPLSLVMLVPAGIGLWIGFRVHDRLDAEKFRRATLAVLVVAGLNLIRRGVLG